MGPKKNAARLRNIPSWGLLITRVPHLGTFQELRYLPVQAQNLIHHPVAPWSPLGPWVAGCVLHPPDHAQAPRDGGGVFFWGGGPGSFIFDRFGEFSEIAGFASPGSIANVRVQGNQNYMRLVTRGIRSHPGSGPPLGAWGSPGSWWGEPWALDYSEFLSSPVGSIKVSSNPRGRRVTEEMTQVK